MTIDNTQIIIPYMFFGNIVLSQQSGIVEQVQKPDTKKSSESEIRARVSLITGNIDIARYVAQELKGLGFDIKSISKRGIGISADKSIYEEVLQTGIVMGQRGNDFTSEVIVPKCIEQQVRSIYFPSKTLKFQTGQENGKN